MLSCFVNFIFDSFVISYWMYFVCDRKKKKLKEQKLCITKNVKQNNTQIYIDKHPKDILREHVIQQENFWIQKLKALVPHRLKQELNK